MGSAAQDSRDAQRFRFTGINRQDIRAKLREMSQDKIAGSFSDGC